MQDAFDPWRQEEGQMDPTLYALGDVSLGGKVVNVHGPKARYKLPEHVARLRTFAAVSESEELVHFLKAAVLYAWRYLRILVLERDARIKISWAQIRDSQLMEAWGRQLFATDLEEGERERRNLHAHLRAFSQAYFALLVKVRQVVYSQNEDRVICKFLYSMCTSVCMHLIGLPPFSALIERELNRLLRVVFLGEEQLGGSASTTTGHLAGPAAAALRGASVQEEEAAFLDTMDGMGPDSRAMGILPTMLVDGRRVFLIPSTLNALLQQQQHAEPRPASGKGQALPALSTKESPTGSVAPLGESGAEPLASSGGTGASRPASSQAVPSQAEAPPPAQPVLRTSPAARLGGMHSRRHSMWRAISAISPLAAVSFPPRPSAL